MQRRFFSCMMALGALQTFVFCSEVSDKTDDEVARYVGSYILFGRDSEWDNSPVAVESSQTQVLSFCPPLKDDIVKPSAPNNIKAKNRLSNERKQYKINSSEVITKLVKDTVLIKPFAVPGNRVRTHAIDMRDGDVDLLFHADRESQEEK